MATLGMFRGFLKDLIDRISACLEITIDPDIPTPQELPHILSSLLKVHTQENIIAESRKRERRLLTKHPFDLWASEIIKRE